VSLKGRQPQPLSLQLLFKPSQEPQHQSQLDRQLLFALRPILLQLLLLRLIKRPINQRQSFRRRRELRHQ